MDSDCNRLDEFMPGKEDTFEGFARVSRDGSVRFEPCKEPNNSEELGLLRSMCVELDVGLH